MGSGASIEGDPKKSKKKHNRGGTHGDDRVGSGLKVGGVQWLSKHAEKFDLEFHDVEVLWLRFLEISAIDEEGEEEGEIYLEDLLQLKVVKENELLKRFIITMPFNKNSVGPPHFFLFLFIC